MQRFRPTGIDRLTAQWGGHQDGHAQQDRSHCTFLMRTGKADHAEGLVAGRGGRVGGPLLQCISNACLTCSSFPVGDQNDDAHSGCPATRCQTTNKMLEHRCEQVHVVAPPASTDASLADVLPWHRPRAIGGGGSRAPTLLRNRSVITPRAGGDVCAVGASPVPGPRRNPPRPSRRSQQSIRAHR